MTDNLVKQYNKLIIGEPTIVSEILNVNGDAIVTGYSYIGDTSTYIGLDIYGNIIFGDVISGEKTLAELVGGGGGSSSRIENIATTSYLEFGTSGADAFITGHSELLTDNTIFQLEDSNSVAVFDINAQGNIYNNGLRVFAFHLTQNNIFIGDKNNTDVFLPTALGNIVIGTSTLEDLDSGDYNVGLGYNSLLNTTTASGSIGIGYQAGLTNLTSDYIISIGYTADGTGADAISIGRGSGSFINSIGIGVLANANDTGVGNISIGYNSRDSGTSGNGNIVLGYSSGDNITGSQNIIIGYEAAKNGTFTGGENTLIGRSSGTTLSTGARNIFIGSYSGRYETGSDSLIISSLNATQQVNEATARTKVLIYGISNTTTSNQTLALNAAVTVTNTLIANNIRLTEYQTLTSSATITMDIDTSKNAFLSLAHNSTLTISNLVDGDEGNIIVTNTGSFTFALSNTHKIIGGVSFGAKASSTTVWSYTYDGTTVYLTFGEDYA